MQKAVLPCFPLPLPRVEQRSRRLNPLHEGHPGAQRRQDEHDDRQGDSDVERALHEAVERVLQRLLLERVEVAPLLGDRHKRLRVALLDVAVDQQPAAPVAAGRDDAARLVVVDRQFEHDHLADELLLEHPRQVGRSCRAREPRGRRDRRAGPPARGLPRGRSRAAPCSPIHSRTFSNDPGFPMKTVGRRWPFWKTKRASLPGAQGVQERRARASTTPGSVPRKSRLMLWSCVANIIANRSMRHQGHLPRRQPGRAAEVRKVEAGRQAARHVARREGHAARPRTGNTAGGSRTRSCG
jgi:hypothetical protein